MKENIPPGAWRGLPKGTVSVPPAAAGPIPPHTHTWACCSPLPHRKGDKAEHLTLASSQASPGSGAYVRYFSSSFHKSQTLEKLSSDCLDFHVGL